MPLAALRPLDDSSERTSRRFRLLLSAEGSAQSRDVAVVLHNLSTTGLLIKCKDELAVGTSIALSLPDLGEVEAIVVWNSGGYYGAAFTAPLSRTAVEGVVSISKVVWPNFSPETADASARRPVVEPVRSSSDLDRLRKPPMVVRAGVILGATGLLWTLLIWAATTL